MKKTTSGFTIVELLIVIVVIAILAAISVVAYTRIQNRTNDSVVQSDLNNFAKVIQLAHAEDRVYPSGSYIMPSAGVWSGSIGGPIGEAKFSVSRASYMEPLSGGSLNLVYCTGVGANGEVGFGVVGQSKSGNLYRYSSEAGLQFLGRLGVTIDRACGGLDYPRTASSGYVTNSGGWTEWTEVLMAYSFRAEPKVHPSHLLNPAK